MSDLCKRLEEDPVIIQASPEETMKLIDAVAQMREALNGAQNIIHEEFCSDECHQFCKELTKRSKKVKALLK